MTSGSMRPLSTWSFGQLIGAASAWTALVLVVAFVTPTGRFLLWLNATLRAGETVNVDIPVTAIKVWFLVVPALAFGPPAVALIAWLRGRGVR